MSIFKKVALFSLITTLPVSQVFAEVDPNFHIYLLFGQSNMAGGAGGSTDQAGRSLITDECDTNSRVKVMAFGDCNQNSNPCPNRKVQRKHQQWYTAFPPYHNCHEGIGPADNFGRTLLDSIRKDITIGFVPCALSGQNIAVFEKGKNAQIDDHTRPVVNGTKLPSGAYEWMRDKCKVAQQTGVIKGILFHQGESNSGEANWPERVKKIVDDLKADLNLWDSIPFIAGEMRYDGCCKNHNTQIAKLPGLIPNCAVASADGLQRRSATDNFHFNLPGTNEFGFRYAKAFLKLASNDWIPRIGSVKIASPRSVTQRKITTTTNVALSIYTLDGHAINTFNKISTENALRTIKAKGVYIISRKLENGVIVSAPFIKN
ncbi:MAG: hypothetical protein JW915_01940 [Chitinispirillaceae bacterium]|nr:hypothetical protein [Chitinispirillaceae bacterium]